MMPESLSQEFQKLLKSARSQRSGEPITDETQKGYLYVFKDFFAFIDERHKERQIAHLSDFRPEDLKEYRVLLESKTEKLKAISVLGHLMSLKGIFRAAFAKGLTGQNISDELKVHYPKSEEQYRRLHADEVARLCAVDEKRLQKMDIKGQFIYLRDKTMAAIQKNAALRASEVVNLSLDDILWSQKSHGEHVPVVIWESKDRPIGHKDTAYLSPWGLGYLRRYLEIRKAYLETAGLRAEQAKTPKSHKPTGEAIFVSANNGGCLHHLTYKGKIFPDLIRDADLPLEYTSHYLRHTQISEWVESGLDPKRVQRLARHKDLQMTLKYYHFNEKELVEDLDRRFGNKPARSKVEHQLLPEKAVRLEIIRHTLSSTGQTADQKIIEAIDAGLQGVWKTGTPQELYYSVHETCAKLEIGRTQLYMHWIKSGRLHSLTLGKNTVFLRTEVDELVSYRTSEEASRALGYREKVPVTVSRLAERGIIPAVKMGRGWRFKDKDLINFALDKRSGRVRLKSRLNKKDISLPHSEILFALPNNLRIHNEGMV